MISLLAWPRALLLVLAPTTLLSTFVEAKVDSLFTSSVTYCSPPEAILIEQFSIIYFASNQSVSFNISAASVVPNLRVRANIFLNVYGMQPVNVTEDFCQAFSDSLCPLPTYNFTGSTSLKLPASIDVASKVPNIAYKIPDLEAFAQLTLTDSSTGEVAACIQATLSNGWSSRQPAVAFATGGFAIFALFSALLHSLLPSTPFAPATSYALPSIAPARFVDFVLLIQQISFTGMLHLNFPLVYRAFTVNFAWALGLFPESQPIQSAIDNMRRMTGGNMQDDVQSPTAFVDRQLSPYNVPSPGKSSSSFYLQHANSAFSTLNTIFESTGATTDSSADAGPPATVTNSAEDILPAGIPLYVNSLNIGTANASMSVFFTVLIGVVVGAGLLGIMYLLLTFAVTRLKGNQWAWADVMHAELRWFAVSNGIRFAMVILYPVLIFTFFQWTLHDSWLSALLSAILFLCTSAALLYPAVRTLLLARRTTAQTLYTTPSYLRTFGALYIPFSQDRFYFFLPFLVAALFKSVFIGFVKTHGIAQVIALLIIELALLVLLCIKKPHRTRGADVLGIYLAVTRVAAVVLMLPFVESLHIKAIPRVVVGLVIMVIFSIAVVVMVINVVFNFGIGLLWRRHSDKSLGSSDGSVVTEMEKGSLWSPPVPPPTIIVRPTNPTPSTSFSQVASAHSRHAPSANAAVSPNFTIPSFYSSDQEEGESASLRRSRRSSFFTASSPPSSAQHEASWSPRNHVSQPDTTVTEQK